MDEIIKNLNKNKKMISEELKEKYGIEPIMKEMWVWHDNIEDAFFWLVVYKDCKYEFPYLIIDEDGGTNYYKHASEKNPNEPKVGDWGYFWWNHDRPIYQGYLTGISIWKGEKTYHCHSIPFHHFSKEELPWMADKKFKTTSFYQQNCNRLSDREMDVMNGTRWP
jgi:hypothetical protein